MALESAKCPNCAAEIQVPSDRDETFCAYCGSKIKTKAAIGFFQVEVKGKVQIDTAPAVQAKLQRGWETGEPQYFKDALDIDPNCYEAKLGFIGTEEAHYGAFYNSLNMNFAHHSDYLEIKNNCSFEYRFGRIFHGRMKNDFISLKEKDLIWVVRRCARNFLNHQEAYFNKKERNKLIKLNCINRVFDELADILVIAEKESVSMEKEKKFLLCCVRSLYDEAVERKLLTPVETDKPFLLRSKDGKEINNALKEVEKSIAKLKQLGYL